MNNQHQLGKTYASFFPATGLFQPIKTALDHSWEESFQVWKRGARGPATYWGNSPAFPVQEIGRQFST